MKSHVKSPLSISLAIAAIPNDAITVLISDEVFFLRTKKNPTLLGMTIVSNWRTAFCGKCMIGLPKRPETAPETHYLISSELRRRNSPNLPHRVTKYSADRRYFFPEIPSIQFPI